MSNNKVPTNFPKLYNGKLNPIFNTADFEQNYATSGDLSNYANLYADNTFVGANSFFGITVQSINNVSSTVLGFLVNINEDVQSTLTSLSNDIATNLQSINNILQSITGISYDSANNVTAIDDNVYVNNISTDNNVAISNNCSVANTLIVSTINNQYLNSNNISCSTITTNQIQCNGSIQFQSDIGCFIYVIVYIPATGQTYSPSFLGMPLMKSQYISNLFVPTSPFICLVTIKPNYSIYFYDASNILIGSLENTTSDFLYNRRFDFTVSPYKINLTLNGIILN